MIEDLVRKNRSCRRFYQNHTIELELLKELVNLARLSPSAANLQPLKYIISCKAETNDLIFPCLKWAAYLRDWEGPVEGERPTSYIIILGDTRITKNFGCDHGIASQSILLGAREKGLAGCMIGAIERENLKKNLNIPDEYEILIVIAIGRPREEIAIVKVKDGDIRYYRDDNKVHYVPKRDLEEVLIGKYS
ncbi:MAG: nitroreductase family protein [Desulfobacterales bacterium]|nr:nitroreductase family protein [Desulfobacterales bacterium]